MAEFKLNLVLGFFVIVFITLCFSSCGGSKDLSAHNYFNGARLYNDSLNLTIKFPGDVRFKSEFNSNKVKKEIKKIPQLKNTIPIVLANTTVPPYYESILFYEEQKPVGYEEDVPKIKLLVEDTINRQVLYQSDFGSKSIYLLLKSTESDPNSIFVLKPDGKNIIKSATFDISVKKELDYWDIFNQYRYEDNILFLSKKIKNAPVEITPENKWVKKQILLTLLSRDPSYKKFKKLIQQPEREAYLHPIIEIALRNKEGVYESDTKVFQKIKELGQKERVIMLNESHWMPNNRILATQLLDPLKEAGFHYLAVEAVYEDKDRYLNDREVPTHTTGYYVREPYFGLFLRRAKELGFEILSYDRFDTENRELKQAQNIYNIIKNDPDAKVFVYAGLSHIFEKEAKYDYKRMAIYFKEISQIDPITIDQTTLLSDIKEKITLFDSKFFPDDKKIEKNTDYFLLNTIKPGLSELYPEEDLHLIQLEVPGLLKYKDQEVFISAFIAKEYEKYKNNSISIKNKIHRVKDDKINLTLPKSDVYIRIQDEGNNLIYLKKMD